MKMMKMSNMITTTRTTRLLPTAQTMPLTCSARCSMALTGWTTTGAPTTTRTRWAACLTSRTCSTPCASRGPLETFGTVKLGEVKMFTKCCEKGKNKLCMHQDIKNKVESNFGPMEDILQETQLTEHEFFPLVMQLL